jgi:glycosyltransferase involved in cell wall biosynthesis
LVYDSHELFTEVPELESNSFAKKTWLALEKWIVPKLKHGITVNQSIANILRERYGVPFMVLRNMPYRYHPKTKKTRQELGLPEDKKIIILQGNGINVRRGAEEAVEAMKYLKVPAVLLVVGNGDVIPVLKETVSAENLSDRVIFKGRLPFDEMMQYTCNADLGITFDKGDNLNYLYSLPNKIFDYIQAEIPVLSSRLPELEGIIHQYEIGECIDSHHPEHIAQMLELCLTNEELRLKWHKNLSLAANILCRENEEIELREMYGQFLRK